MIKSKRVILVVALMVTVVALAACTRNAGAEGTETPLTGSGTGPLTTIVSSEEVLAGSSFPAVQLLAGSQQVGIFVNGTGSVTVSPDTAILTLGVQARRDTVAQARDDAATAMANIIDVLTGHGVAEEDIKTQFLSIQPVYNYRSDPPVLEGFEVMNTVRVKIRDLDAVGPVIDGVVDAGGDLTRIQGISFTVDDPSPLQAGLREMAVQDAVAKAQQLAALVGVTLGPPISISEGGGAVPFSDVAFMAAAVEEFAVATPVSPGEMELRLSVSIAFAIQ